MKTLEKIHSEALRNISKFVLPQYPIRHKVLVFVDMGIGNIVWMIPLLRQLSRVIETDFICNNRDMSAVIEYNTAARRVINPQPEYCASIQNFLCQRTPDVETVMRLRVPIRIGHLNPARMKYSWLFNHPVPFSFTKQEAESNNDLAHLFTDTDNRFDPITLPPADARRFDILFQVDSSADRSKNYRGWPAVVRALSRQYLCATIGSASERLNSCACDIENHCGTMSLYETAQTIAKARLVVGNDGGLVKIADALGIPAIQVLTIQGVDNERAKLINGRTIKEPQAEELIELIKGIL